MYLLWHVKNQSQHIYCAFSTQVHRYRFRKNTGAQFLADLDPQWKIDSGCTWGYWSVQTVFLVWRISKWHWSALVWQRWKFTSELRDKSFSICTAKIQLYFHNVVLVMNKVWMLHNLFCLVRTWGRQKVQFQMYGSVKRMVKVACACSVEPTFTLLDCLLLQRWMLLQPSRRLKPIQFSHLQKWQNTSPTSMEFPLMWVPVFFNKNALWCAKMCVLCFGNPAKRKKKGTVL